MYNKKVIEYRHSTEIRLYEFPMVESKKHQEFENEQQNTSTEKKPLTKREERERTKEMVERSRSESVKRSKGNILKMARANDWDYFVTFTFRDGAVDAYSYPEVYNKVKLFWSNLKRVNPDVKYLGVPERCPTSGRWHFHFLVSNVDLKYVQHSYWKLDKSSGVKIYKWDRWIYGWSTASEIQDQARSCSYLTKYITKEMADVENMKHRYIRSDNLEDPVEEVSTVENALDIISEHFAAGHYVKEVKVSEAGNRVWYIQVPKD